MKTVSRKVDLPVTLCQVSSIADDDHFVVDCRPECKGEMLSDLICESHDRHMAFMVAECEDCGRHAAFAMHDQMVFASSPSVLISEILFRTGARYRLVAPYIIRGF